MATYEERIAAAQAAQNEGRGDAARLLAQRAVDLRTSAEEEPEQTVIGSIARGAGAGLVVHPMHGVEDHAPTVGDGLSLAPGWA